MATATDIQQPRIQPVQVQAQALAQAKPRLQAQQINIQKRSQPLPKEAAKLATLNVNRAIKRDSGHSNNSNMSGNSMYTHAHTHQKNGSASSDGTEVGVREANAGEKELSFSQRAAQLARSPTPLLVKGDQRLLRDIDRPLPGDGARMSIVGDAIADGVLTGPPGQGQGQDQGQGQEVPLARKRSQYFEDAFATRRDTGTTPAKERVRSEALVLADVRTNVIVGDEFTVVTELSAHLALRYRRPLSSIVVTLQHGACMCFGGSFAPAYVMAVYNLPSQLQPATNKRNAALIQRHMEETLGVPPARGHLRFVDVPEANLAYGGKTALGHADDLARAATTTEGNVGVHGGGPNGMYRSPVGSVTSPGADAQSLGSGLGSRKYKTARKLSVKSLSSFRAPSPAPSELTPPPSAVDEQTPAAQLPAIPERSVKDDASAGAKGGKIKKDGQKSKSSTSPTQAISGIKTPPVPVSPASPSPAAVDRQPSRRARRTKSFVATLLFGRSTPKPEGEA